MARMDAEQAERSIAVQRASKRLNESHRRLGTMKVILEADGHRRNNRA
jgi:hypothetical protein